jgi:hypothetical protein
MTSLLDTENESNSVVTGGGVIWTNDMEVGKLKIED